MKKNYDIFAAEKKGGAIIDKSKNQINVLYPYRTHGGTWVYDDPDLNVYSEAFVCGSSELIDHLVGMDCNKFTAYVSAMPIPGHDIKLNNIDHIVNDGIQGWYNLDGTDMRNWFCGHLTDYISGYSSAIYIRLENKRK